MHTPRAAMEDILALRRQFSRASFGTHTNVPEVTVMEIVELGVEVDEQVVGVSPPTVPVWAASGSTPKTYTTTEDHCRECETRKSLLVRL